MRRILALALLTTLMGAGCAAAPAPTTTPTPSPAATTPESTPPAVTTPTPTPTPTPEPTPKPAATKPAPKPAVKTVTVEMRDNAFSPQIIAINAGDTIVWKNVGQGTHTVRNSTGVQWDSGSLAPGGTYRRTFSSSGRYDYYCANHSGMSGSVIVGEVRPQ